MNVFLVDDDEIIRKGLRSIIEKSNLNCTVTGEASDGELALQALECSEKVDLLITDIRMPVMDGLELIKQIREQDKYQLMKIIVLSGYDEFKYVRNAFMDGAVDYILKPINKNDFLDLLKKIQSSIEYEAEQESSRRESKQLLISNTLNRLFHYPVHDEQEEERNLKKINLDLERQYYLVMICRIDNFYKQNMEQMKYAGALDKIYHQIDEWIDKKSNFQLLQFINRNEIVYLVCSSEYINANQISEEIYQEICQTNMDDTTYTMGVGTVYKGILNIQKAYQEAYTSVEARFYLGWNHRIEYEQIKDKIIELSYNLEPKLNKLIQSIELYDYINSKKVIDEIFVDLCYVTAARFRKYINELVDLLILRVKDFEEALMCCSHDYQFFLDNINTYNELKSFISSIIKDVIDYIRNEREKRSKKRIELAKKYISEHYKENITLNDVADYIELNASYFSNLFKLEVGTNFSDYLLEVRMQMARTLLRNPTIKVYEIGCMVGYEDAVSFGRAFKKKVGMSPKEYRDTVY
jgi:two-component system, response regulator YesN